MSARGRSPQRSKPEVQHDKLRGVEPLWLGVPRGVSLFFGALLLLELVSDLQSNSSHAGPVWLPLEPCTVPVARGLLALCGVSFIVFGLTSRPPGWICLAARILAVCGILRGAMELGTPAMLLVAKSGAARQAWALPVWLVVCFFIVAVGLWYGPRDSTGRLGSWLLIVFSFVVCAISFPVVQMLTRPHITAATTVVIMPNSSMTTELLDAGMHVFRETGATKILLPPSVYHPVHDAGQLPALGNGAVLFPKQVSLAAMLRSAAEIAAEDGSDEIVAVAAWTAVPLIRRTCRRELLSITTIPVRPRRFGPAEYRDAARAIRDYWRLLVVPLLDPELITIPVDS